MKQIVNRSNFHLFIFNTENCLTNIGLTRGGVGSVMKGTVIAYSLIISITNAVDARLIALNGAVTLDTNQITRK